MSNGQLDLVDVRVLADPPNSAGFDALRQNQAAPLASEHHYLCAGRHQWSDEIDTTAHAVPEVEVEEDTLRLEAFSMSDHIARSRTAGGLDLPTTGGQRQLR